MLDRIRPLFVGFLRSRRLSSYICDSGPKIRASGKLRKFSRKLVELAEIYLKQKLLYGSIINRDR